MATFEVDVGGSTYEVDAPDESTAWNWANKTHSKNQSSLPSDSVNQKTQADYQRETLADMPWAQRQLVGAGGALNKGYQGIKGLFGGEIDKEAVKAADVAGEEAPIGSMIGEMAKYVPAVAAGTAVLPSAAISAALGFAYDPTGNRGTSAALEGAFGAGGALIGKAIPRIAGAVGNNVQRLRELMGGDKSVRYYGSADKASEAAKTIIGIDNQIAASKMLGKAGDVKTAQALAEIPNAEGISVLDKLMRSEEGIKAAEYPMEATREYLSQAKRQDAARMIGMAEMAQGGSAQESALARDLFSKLTALDLKPVERDILSKLAEPGRQLSEILPVLQTLERGYITALQNKGARAAEGAVATSGQAERIGVSPNPSFGSKYAPKYLRSRVGGEAPVDATKGFESAIAENEAAATASGLRSAADKLRDEISALPSVFTAAPVRNSAASVAATGMPAERTVMKSVSDELARIGDDPVKLAEFRRVGVNQLIGELSTTGKLSKMDAADELLKVKKLIDNQLGEDYVTKYLEPYSKALTERDSIKLSDKLRQLQQYQPEEFMKVMRGDSPELVAEYGNWKTIQEALGESRYAKSKQISGEMVRDKSIKEMAESPEAMAAVNEVLSEKSITRHLPNLLNRYIVLANTAIKSGEMKVNKEMYRELDNAMRDPKAMKALIDQLPPEQRSKMIGYALQLGKGAPVASAAYGEQVRK